MGHSQVLPSPSNLAFVEDLYEKYLCDPNSVAADWKQYFSGILNGDSTSRDRSPLHPKHKPRSIFNPAAAAEIRAPRSGGDMGDRVYMLIRLFRVRGHRIAKVDPLGRPIETPPELTPEFFGFTQADMDQPVTCESYGYRGPLTLRSLLERLRNTYCRSIGVQYMHIDELSVRRWLQSRMEATENRLELARDEQVRILTRLTDAVVFEEFIRKKFIGAKSFSLEGSESLIPLLDLAIEKAAEQGIDEIVMGMAHRGRLNVLANIMGKSARLIFREFSDNAWKSQPGRGDVKYHLGYSADWTARNGNKLHLSLCFNPSHLEYVNPVAMGRTRAKQDRVKDFERRRGMTLLIHGDAAFAGEGVVQETLNLSQLRAYSVGGTLHVVVNNQLGFTTSPQEARSTTYATDVAKMLQIPIFHVNGEDPEAVAQVVRLAMDFRLEFKRDVVINVYGYRRLGHNEGDEPAFTQPVLYRAIAKRKPVRDGYLDHLLELGGVTRKEADDIAAARRQALETELSEAANANPKPERRGFWSRFHGGAEPVQDREWLTVDDAHSHGGAVKVSVEMLSSILKSQTELPPDFHPHPKIKKWLEARASMGAGEHPLDWAAAESLAFASLAEAGVRVRLTGQDSERGTFSQRHAVLHDFQDGHTISLFRHSSARAPIEICNSPLSETGVLGFEYGYSLDFPDALVLWEAQFGDFWNAAQPIVDQFIASAEEKWQRLSGLVLLLPHGMEGQGPEHSSARIERFLHLFAEDNLQVVYPSTPAQYYHCLRRQALRSWRKPLVVMTPKSLLRHASVVSSLEDCADGAFRAIIPDRLPQDERKAAEDRRAPKLVGRSNGPGPHASVMECAGPPALSNRDRISRILLCSGKIFYELDAYRTESKRDDAAIIRIEQLAPLRTQELEQALSLYRDGIPVIWVQEESVNVGPFAYLKVRFGDKLFGRFPFSAVTRPPSASPASGSSKRHKHEQAELIKAAS